MPIIMGKGSCLRLSEHAKATSTCLMGNRSRRRSSLALDAFGGKPLGFNARRPGPLALDGCAEQTLGFTALALMKIRHRAAGGIAEPVLWLADGRQRHA